MQDCWRPPATGWHDEKQASEQDSSDHPSQGWHGLGKFGRRSHKSSVRRSRILLFSPGGYPVRNISNVKASSASGQ